MTIKTLEIRDVGTFIPALAIQITGHDGYLFRRAGFGYDNPCVLLINLARMEAQYDPYSWSPAAMRTMGVAHNFICEAFDDLADGDVVDVEFILKETSVRKTSEQTFVP
jgi:hypothetical protein